jgi:hypothetical protein
LLTAGLIRIYGYGWHDSKTKPWEHPAQVCFFVLLLGFSTWLLRTIFLQNPDMGLIEPQHPYIFSVHKQDVLCSYSIVDALSGSVVANATTPQLSGGLDSGVRFALYFGGEVPATQDVTVSYTEDPHCL